jgi:hypothetical protein
MPDVDGRVILKLILRIVCLGEDWIKPAQDTIQRRRIYGISE